MNRNGPIIALLILAAFALSACMFTSAAPLFAPERGACPFPTGQRFETLQSDPEEGPLTAGAEKPVLTVAVDGTHCVLTRDDEPEPQRTLFIPMGRNAWIVQSETGGPLYFVARRRGDRLTFHFPDCDHFSARRLRRLGVVTEDESGRTTCLASDARQIETLFRSWRTRAPAQIYRAL